MTEEGRSLGPLLGDPGLNGILNLWFGDAISTADFDNDGFTELIIGVTRFDVGDLDSAGAVHVIKGTRDGLVVSGNQL